MQSFQYRIRAVFISLVIAALGSYVVWVLLDYTTCPMSDVTLQPLVDNTIKGSKKEVEYNQSEDYQSEDYQSKDSNDFDVSAVDMTPGGTKTILLWTTCYGIEWQEAQFKDRTSASIIRGCEYNNCVITSDKSKLNVANVVMFHHKDPPNFPQVRYPGQLYCHQTMDPPKLPNETYLDQYEDILNMTINYSPEADIFHPYGTFKPSETFNTSRNYIPKTPFKSKIKSVAWMVSHCDTNSKRELYVQELRKYIDVDIFGSCGNITCPKNLGYMHCLQQIENRYKFYLSFENNICPDYYSEKLTNPLKLELIPVVLGWHNHTRNVVPAHSIIDARDFSSPKDLAQYLKYLSTNETEYNKYFQWKVKYDQQGPSNPLCKVCQILHSEQYVTGKPILPSYKKYGGYRKWWQDSCDNDLVERLRRTGGW